MRDLPPVGGTCSTATAINASDGVVGATTDCHGNDLRALLWKNGTAVDLNTLVAPAPGQMTMTFPSQIDDQGQIAGVGFTPDGNVHSFVLVPNRHGS